MQSKLHMTYTGMHRVSMTEGVPKKQHKGDEDDTKDKHLPCEQP